MILGKKGPRQQCNGPAALLMNSSYSPRVWNSFLMNDGFWNVGISWRRRFQIDDVSLFLFEISFEIKYRRAFFQLYQTCFSRHGNWPQRRETWTRAVESNRAASRLFSFSNKLLVFKWLKMKGTLLRLIGSLPESGNEFSVSRLPLSCESCYNLFVSFPNTWKHDRTSQSSDVPVAITVVVFYYDRRLPLWINWKRTMNSFPRK